MTSQQWFRQWHQITSYYLNLWQYWSRTMKPCGTTKPQWVNLINSRPACNISHFKQNHLRKILDALIASPFSLGTFLGVSFDDESILDHTMVCCLIANNILSTTSPGISCSNALVLTHWGWDKKANISQITMVKWIFLNENFWISNEILLKYVPYGLLDNKAVLVQIMVWRRKGNKPLSKSMLVCFTEAHMCHPDSMN